MVARVSRSVSVRRLVLGDLVGRGRASPRWRWPARRRPPPGAGRLVVLEAGGGPGADRPAAGPVERRRRAGPRTGAGTALVAAGRSRVSLWPALALGGAPGAASAGAFFGRPAFLAGRLPRPAVLRRRSGWPAASCRPPSWRPAFFADGLLRQRRLVAGRRPRGGGRGCCAVDGAAADAVGRRRLAPRLAQLPFQLVHPARSARRPRRRWPARPRRAPGPPRSAPAWSAPPGWPGRWRRVPRRAPAAGRRSRRPGRPARRATSWAFFRGASVRPMASSR